MAKNKGKPSGKFAEDKTSPGRKGTGRRFGWAEETPIEKLADRTRGSRAGMTRRTRKRRS